VPRHDQLPPRVFDISAPQYPLPDPCYPPPRPLATPSRSAPARPGPRSIKKTFDDDDDSGSIRSSSSSPYRRARPRGSPTEKRLARWLAGRLGFANALAFVSRYGAGPVLDVMHLEGVVVPAERGGWQPNARLRNPGGFLRWATQRQAPALTSASRSGYTSEAPAATESRRLAIGG